MTHRAYRRTAALAFLLMSIAIVLLLAHCGPAPVAAAHVEPIMAAVPEPGEYALCAVSILALLIWRRARR